MTAKPSALIKAIVAAEHDDMRAIMLREAARAMLFDPESMPDIVAAALDPEDDASAEAAISLLSQTLDEARMAAENGAPEGEALIARVATAVMERDAALPFMPGQRLGLAQVYARAGLPIPPFAMLTPEAMKGAEFDSEDMPDLGQLLDPILAELGDAPLQVHAAISELMAGLPGELAGLLVAMTVARPGSVEGRLGLYWLLDRQAGLREAAASALLNRAKAGELPPDLAALLPAIRKWLPEDAARASLDATIREGMRGGNAPRQAAAVSLHRVAASLPDGAGAQSLIAAFQQGSRRGIAMAMLKQGHGIKDAMILPCSSATEQKRMLARILEEIETFDVTPRVLTEGLARGLGEGLSLDLLPAPGLVDLAEIFGSAALSPAPAEAADILANIGGPEALSKLAPARRSACLKASGAWMERFDQGDSWFEDTADLRDAMARARSEKGQETAVWKHLETRRDWWARHFSISAATLQATSDPDIWLSFAAVAQALLDGTSLKRIPIMADIMELTLDAYASREEHLSPRIDAFEGSGALMAHAGISGPYLQGYLTALAISPREPEPEEWLGPLLTGIEFPGSGTLDTVFAHLIMEADRIEEEVGDPAAVKSWISELDSEGLEDWAAGFDQYVSACRQSWPGKSLGADDKRVLREIEAASDGGECSALRAILPAWISRRYALRR